MILTPKKYRCTVCGYETIQSTNHYGDTYSWGTVAMCPTCKPADKFPNKITVWECTEKGEPVPSELSVETIEEKGGKLQNPGCNCSV